MPDVSRNGRCIKKGTCPAKYCGEVPFYYWSYFISFKIRAAIPSLSKPYLWISSFAGPDSPNTSLMPMRVIRVGHFSESTSATAAPRAADNGMFFHSENTAGLLCCSDDQFFIQRFDGMDVDHLSVNAFIGQDLSSI